MKIFELNSWKLHHFRKIYKKNLTKWNLQDFWWVFQIFLKYSWAFSSVDLGSLPYFSPVFGSITLQIIAPVGMSVLSSLK